MSNHKWKYWLNPKNTTALVDLLCEKSDEYDLKGFLEDFTRRDAKRLMNAIVGEVGWDGIWREMTRGEFLELAKIAEECGVIDRLSCKICYRVFYYKLDLRKHMHLVHKERSTFKQFYRLR